MKVFAFLLLVGLAVSGWLVHRHWRRTVPPAVRATPPAVDTWQRSIRLDSRTDYTDPLREKLRREEERQRPQEGRN